LKSQYELTFSENGFIVYSNKMPVISGNLALRTTDGDIFQVSIHSNADIRQVSSFLNAHFTPIKPEVLEIYFQRALKYGVDCDLMLELINPFWSKAVFAVDIESAMKIIDDALSHGFQFKVENGNIWVREL
jgi:hypothetical protein